jgi:hypothetical protein
VACRSRAVAASPTGGEGWYTMQGSSSCGRPTDTRISHRVSGLWTCPKACFGRLGLALYVASGKLESVWFGREQATILTSPSSSEKLELGLSQAAPLIHIFPSIQRANGLMRWTHCAISSCALLKSALGVHLQVGMCSTAVAEFVRICRLRTIPNPVCTPRISCFNRGMFSCTLLYSPTGEHLDDARGVSTRAELICTRCTSSGRHVFNGGCRVRPDLPSAYDPEL